MLHNDEATSIAIDIVMDATVVDSSHHPHSRTNQRKVSTPQLISIITLPMWGGGREGKFTGTLFMHHEDAFLYGLRIL